MKPQNILFISYDGLTDALGQSQILAYLSNLTRPDRKIFILAFEKAENYEKNFQYVNEIVKKANIEWVKLWYHKKPPILSTINDVRQGIKTAKALHEKHCFDVVHCRGHIPGIIGLRLKDAKLIFDMRAWWADEKRDSGHWDKPVYKPVYSYFKSLEKRLFQRADYNISLTYAGKKEILDKKLSEEERIGVIPTCVNLSVFKPFDPAIKEKMRRQLGIPLQSKVLIYSGSIGGNYDMARMVEIFTAFLQVYPDAWILILSKDAVSDAFLSKLNGAGIKNYIIKNIPYREVSDHLQAGDVGMIFYKPAYSNIGRSPTKLAEYWAAGVPVISFRDIGDLQWLFQKYPLGGVLCKEDLSDVKEQIAGLQFGHHEELRQNAIEYFGLPRGVAFYNKVYEDLRTAGRVTKVDVQPIQ
jgi:glycosyltransferase involved in cell wall biosynthesis